MTEKLTNNNHARPVDGALQKVMTDKAYNEKVDARKLLTRLDPFKRLWLRHDTEALAMRGCEFALVLTMRGERLPCKVLECGQYHLYVELQDSGRKCLIYKQDVARLYPCLNEEELLKFEEELALAAAGVSDAEGAPNELSYETVDA